MIAFSGAVLAAALMCSACSVSDGGAPSVRPTSGAHASRLLEGCLQEKGWDAEIDERNGGVRVEFPTAQEDQHNEDYEECVEKYRLNDIPELTSVQYELIYTQLREAAECLTALGYDIPDAPSLAVFTESKGTWSPFSLLPREISVDEFNEAVDQCPQPQL